MRSAEATEEFTSGGEEAPDNSDVATSDTAGGGGSSGVGGCGGGGGRRRLRKGSVAHITMQLLENGGHFDSPIQAHPAFQYAV